MYEVFECRLKDHPYLTEEKIWKIHKKGDFFLSMGCYTSEEEAKRVCERKNQKKKKNS